MTEESFEISASQPVMVGQYLVSRRGLAHGPAIQRSCGASDRTTPIHLSSDHTGGLFEQLVVHCKGQQAPMSGSMERYSGQDCLYLSGAVILSLRGCPWKRVYTVS